MSILFSILVLAFLALLWASVSMVRHLRRAGSGDEHAPTGHSQPEFGPRSTQILRGSR